MAALPQTRSEASPWHCKTCNHKNVESNLCCGAENCLCVALFLPAVSVTYQDACNAFQDTTDEHGLCDVCGDITFCGSLCPRAHKGCTNRFCISCLKEYFTRRVDESSFTAPKMVCPGVSCTQRIPTKRWKVVVSSATMTDYFQRARQAISIRCQICDEMVSLLPAHDPEASSKLLGLTHRNFYSAQRRKKRQLNEILLAWPLFRANRIPAREFAEKVGALLEADSEEEIDSSSQKRSLNPQQLRLFLSSIEDVERRMTLALALLRRFPFITTECCDMKHCFRCQQGHWHVEESCEEADCNDLSIQSCPECCVMISKIDGCNSVLCLCGANFQWQG